MTTNIICIGASQAWLGDSFASQVTVPELKDPHSWYVGTFNAERAEEFRSGDREFLIANCPSGYTLSAPGFSLELSIRTTTDGLQSSAYIWSRAPQAGTVTIHASGSTSIAAQRFVVRARSGNLGYTVHRHDNSANQTLARWPALTVAINETICPIIFQRWAGTSNGHTVIWNHSNIDYVPEPEYATWYTPSSNWVANAFGFQYGRFNGTISQRTIQQGYSSSSQPAWYEMAYIRFRDLGTVRYDVDTYRNAVIASEPLYYWPLEPQDWPERYTYRNRFNTRQSYSHPTIRSLDNRGNKPHNYGTSDVYGFSHACPDLQSSGGQDTGWLCYGTLLQAVGFDEVWESWFLNQRLSFECKIRGRCLGDERLGTNDSETGHPVHLSFWSGTTVGGISGNTQILFNLGSRGSVSRIVFGVTQGDTTYGVPKLFLQQFSGAWGNVEPERMNVITYDLPIVRTDYRHLAFTFGDDLVRLFVDGEIVAEEAMIDMHWGDLYYMKDERYGFLGTGLSANELSFGNLYYDWLGELALWTRTLDPEEVADHANLVNVRLS